MSSKIILALVCLFGFQYVFGQEGSKSVSAREHVVEVSYFKGRSLAYQRVGEWAWYELFERTDNSTATASDPPVAAVKLTPRSEENVIKLRVTVLKGRNHETEDFVADYSLSPGSKMAIRELTKCGIVPFEIGLARSPSTVAELPAVINKTRSLEISLEPTSSSLPSVKARFLNNSQKAIAAFACHTSIDGQRKLGMVPQNKDKSPLIQPGATYERFIRYPLKLSPVSTGEVPGAQSGLVLNVTAVGKF